MAFFDVIRLFGFSVGLLLVVQLRLPLPRLLAVKTRLISLADSLTQALLATAGNATPGARGATKVYASAATKLLWLLGAALVSGPVVHAQAIAAENVPPLAFGAMSQQYPQARQVTWRRFQDWYQASYTQSQVHRLVRFSINGDVEATGQDIALGALSLPIQHTLTTYYPTRTFCRAIEVTNARTKGLTYEMATCETAFSRTITLMANGRKIPRPQ